jgi:DNA-binding NtrC family response regulator
MEDTMDMADVDRELTSQLHRRAPGPVLSGLDLRTAVQSDACVLLTGDENAVQTVAYRIHSLSGWRHGPFTVIDCGWPDARVESVLFDAFADTEPPTPAEPYPRLAQSGTVLLREVGRLGATMQSTLADLLVRLRGQRRRGRSRRRLMASTSEPLLPRVLDGTFDDRLFYRLNLIHLVIRSGGSAGDTRPSASRVPA